jgi:hypothetical protein
VSVGRREPACFPKQSDIGRIGRNENSNRTFGQRLDKSKRRTAATHSPSLEGLVSLSARGVPATEIQEKLTTRNTS